MEVNNLAENKDGVETRPSAVDVPPSGERAKQSDIDENLKKKRRRGKSKRKIMKPFLKVPWQNKRRNEKSKRNNKFRKLVLSKTHAPYNNNQFLMEIHKPEPENNFEILQAPSARTRDSSFSVDSDENYFYSLPEDEEDFLTKEFSSVYEDAQSERLTNMSKNELIQEYLLLEAKYENLVKRTERYKHKTFEDEKDTTGTDNTSTDKDSVTTDRDTTGTSFELSMTDTHTLEQRLKEQDELIRELKLANEKLRLENESLNQRCSSSADSESDSSSTSISCSSSNNSRSSSPIASHMELTDNNALEGELVNDHSAMERTDNNIGHPLVNGFHNGQRENEEGLIE